MKVSTNITDNDERETIFEKMIANYGTVKGDCYISVLSDELSFSTYGEVVQYSTEDLGADGRLSRVVDVKKKIEEGGNKLDNIVSHHQEVIRKAEKKMGELEKKNLRLDEQIAGQGDMSKLRKNRAAQSKLRSLIKQRETVDDEMAKVTGDLEESTLKIEKFREKWAERKELYYEDMVREQESIEIIERRLEILYAEKRHVEMELTDLGVGKYSSHRIINGQLYRDRTKSDELCTGFKIDGAPCQAKKQNGHDTCFQHRDQEGTIELDTDLENLSQIQQIKRTVSGFLEKSMVPQSIKEYAKRRNLTNYMIRLEKEIEKLQLEIRGGGGSRIQNVYVTRSYDLGGSKEGDLVCFSREFDSSNVSLKGEMSFITRTEADIDVLFRLNRYITWVLGILTLGLFGLLVSNVDINILNAHTFYWITGFFLFYHLYNSFLQRDRVFEGLYDYIDWSVRYVSYEDEGTVKTIKMKCYHLEMLSSDEVSYAKKQVTGVDDVQRYKDSTLTARLERLQGDNTNLQVDLISLESNNNGLANLNQKLAARNEQLRGDLAADIHRDYNEMQPRSTQRGDSKYMWITIAVIGSLFVLSWILPRVLPSQINVNKSAPNTTWDISPAILIGAVVLTALIVILPARWMRSS